MDLPPKCGHGVPWDGCYWCCSKTFSELRRMFRSYGMEDTFLVHPSTDQYFPSGAAGEGAAATAITPRSRKKGSR